MEVSAWSDGKNTYGIRIGKPNREKYFDRNWSDIEVEIDGKSHTFNLTAGFWNQCSEFRDSGSTVIRDWLKRHKSINWDKGKPHHFQLLPQGGQRFKLVP